MADDQVRPVAVVVAIDPVASGFMTVKLRPGRLTWAALAFAGIVLASMMTCMNGFELESFPSASYDADGLDNLQAAYTIMVSSVVSLFGIPVDFLLSSLISVFFMAFASEGYVKENRSPGLKLLLFLIPTACTYLLSNGYNGINVQASPKGVVPFMNDSDIRISTSTVDFLSEISTNVSNIAFEDDDCNVVTNTVLRNVIVPIVLKAAPTCSHSFGMNDTSGFADGLVQSFGFPIRDWQQWVGVSNCIASGASCSISVNGSDSLSESSTAFLGTGMTLQMATNVFIHGLHISRHFFRWFNNKSMPFNVTGLIQDHKQPDISSSISRPTHSISAAELLNLTKPSTSSFDQVEWFLESARGLFGNSLGSAVNISQNEALMEFTHVLVGQNITFDAVTFEVPLRRNFYYRKLVLGFDSEELIEDTQATETYTDISNAGNTSDIYFDLDVRADCGPYPYSCVLPRVQEYDSDGNEYQPNPQIKATAICLNSLGTEDFQIDYIYYADPSSPLDTHLEAAWACNNKSSSSMWIVSFGSRIVADDMYDRPAPDTANPSLDIHRATIVNPRKIYSLTVGRFAWDTIDFEPEFNATCSAGTGKCRGMRYEQLDSFRKSNELGKYVLVAEDSIPMHRLEPFAYNSTESGGTYSGNSSTATRWVPLMSLSTPAEDAMYSRKGDVILRYHIANYGDWSSQVRRGENCSLSAEDHLNHVVNNHFFMGHGMQSAYVSGLYFLFQNGVVRDITNQTTTGSALTLAFDGNVPWTTVVVSTPIWSAGLSFIGIGIVYIVTAAAMIWSCFGTRAVIKNSSTVSADRLAGMKISWLLDFHFNGNHIKIDAKEET